ncbi:CR3L4 protein, partial [Pandion haliaetus]|nr:CR3L4 protein [Pandion haliaetus]
MSSPEDLPALINEDLLDFILKDDVPCPELPELENGLLEDWGMLEGKVSSLGGIAAGLWFRRTGSLLRKSFSPQVLDKEIDDFISSLLTPFADKPGTLLDYSPANSDSGISEGQLLPCSPSSSIASSSWNSGIVQADHNYSLSGDWPMLESKMSDMAQGGASVDLGNFPVAMDAGLQLVPRATRQVLTGKRSKFPKLVLTEEERKLLVKEGVSLPTHLPLTKTQERLLKKVRRRIRNKQSASDSRRRRKMYVDDLESRLAACTAQNQKLEKKVQLLQKQNTSLLKQVQRLRAFVRRSRTRTTITTCGMVVVLSLCLVVPPSIHSPGSRDTQLEITVQSQRIRQIQDQVAPNVQEDAVLQGFSSQPEDPSLSGSLNPSWEEGQSPPNPDASTSFNSNSSSDPAVAEGSELGPPQPEEQHFESNPVQTVVSMVWKTKRQEEGQHAATVVIEQHRANRM